PGIDFVPELDLWLTKTPAQQHVPAVHLARKIDEPEAAVLELNAERFELALVAVDLTRERLRFTLELIGAIPRLIRARRRRDEIELENGFTPAPMLNDDVFDDLSYERQCAIGLIDREQLHLDSRDEG